MDVELRSKDPRHQTVFLKATAVDIATSAVIVFLAVPFIVPGFLNKGSDFQSTVLICWRLTGILTAFHAQNL